MSNILFLSTATSIPAVADVDFAEALAADLGQRSRTQPQQQPVTFKLRLVQRSKPVHGLQHCNLASKRDVVEMPRPSSENVGVDFSGLTGEVTLFGGPGVGDAAQFG
jgi:hypothetical protein